MIWQPVRHRLQTELIKRGHCVACCRSLAEAERHKSRKNPRIEIVFCECRRIYSYNSQLNHYQRAVPAEVKKHLGILLK